MKGGSLKEGLTKKEKFTPHSQNPPETKVGRPKHDNKKIKRHAAKTCC